MCYEANQEIELLREALISSEAARFTMKEALLEACENLQKEITDHDKTALQLAEKEEALALVSLALNDVVNEKYENEENEEFDIVYLENDQDMFLNEQGVFEIAYDEEYVNENEDSLYEDDEDDEELYILEYDDSSEEDENYEGVDWSLYEDEEELYIPEYDSSEDCDCATNSDNDLEFLSNKLQNFETTTSGAISYLADDLARLEDLVWDITNNGILPILVREFVELPSKTFQYLKNSLRDLL